MTFRCQRSQVQWTHGRSHSVLPRLPAVRRGRGAGRPRRAACGGRASGAWVGVGYLNYSQPTFAEAVAECAAQGATRIVVLPFFLVPGYFVTKSLPEQLEAARADYPELEFVVADALGFDTGLADALIASAQGPLGPDAVARRPDRRRARLPRPPGLPAVRHAQLPARPSPGHAAQPFVDLNRGDKSLRKPRMKTALLVMVHGSPRPVANEDMFRVVEEVKRRGAFDVVEVGFMECNAPTIPDGHRRLRRAGGGAGHGRAVLPAHGHARRRRSADPAGRGAGAAPIRRVRDGPLSGRRRRC